MLQAAARAFFPLLLHRGAQRLRLQGIELRVKQTLRAIYGELLAVLQAFQHKGIDTDGGSTRER